jgi:glucose/arabinose dehydrogenase
MRSQVESQGIKVMYLKIGGVPIMKKNKKILLFLLGLLPTIANGDVALQHVFEDINFQRPLAFVADPEKLNVWYVVEQAGRVVRIDGQSQKTRDSIFIDITDRVESGPNEAGLLGMAFDPKFGSNGRIYLSYTSTKPQSRSVFDRLLGDSGKLMSTLSRFVITDGGLTLNEDSEHKLLQVNQPYSNHNGGDIHFGPDGYLYYGLGDGGSGGDPEANGQNKQTLLGAMLRLDVSGRDGYVIPEGNPFLKKDGKPEIYAYGLRNPWRWSFDRKTGELWAADVGQNRWEEVNLIKRGENYGWNLREGKHCFSGNCKQEALIDPVVEYSHDEGCSITGGYVYRGKAIPLLNGFYIYGDYCSGTIWGFDVAKEDNAKPQILLNTDLNISSFGEDKNGEIYVVDLKGKLFKLVKE